jgi:hypothetical protein
MTIESAVGDLTTATTALTSAVLTQQTSVVAAVAAFAATTGRVNTGLNNVDNTADADKPLSTADITALAGKQITLVSGVNISTIDGFDLLSGAPIIITKAKAVNNLLMYENRADMRNIAGAIGESYVVDGLGFFMWMSGTIEPDDDETCFTVLPHNDVTGQWLLSLPHSDLLSAWALIEDAFRDELDEDEVKRLSSTVILK